MKKCKITVLKTTLDKELAEEYGVPGLGACPMMREGQVFYADYANMRSRKASAMRRGKQSISMYLHFLTARERDFFTTATGSESRELRYAAAMTVYGR